MTDGQTDRQTDEQMDDKTDRHTDRHKQSDRQIDRQTGKQSDQYRDREIDKNSGRKKDTQQDRQAHIHAERYTNRCTDSQTDGQTNRHSDRYMDRRFKFPHVTVQTSAIHNTQGTVMIKTTLKELHTKTSLHYLKIYHFRYCPYVSINVSFLFNSNTSNTSRTNSYFQMECVKVKQKVRQYAHHKASWATLV